MADPKPVTTKFPLDKPEDKVAGDRPGKDNPPSGDSPKPHGDPLGDTIKGNADR